MGSEVRERVRDANDIVDIIGERMQLKRQGKNYIGLCPFHQEKTPSFTVSPEKQLFTVLAARWGEMFSSLSNSGRRLILGGPWRSWPKGPVYPCGNRLPGNRNANKSENPYIRF